MRSNTSVSLYGYIGVMNGAAQEREVCLTASNGSPARGRILQKAWKRVESLLHHVCFALRKVIASPEDLDWIEALKFAEDCLQTDEEITPQQRSELARQVAMCVHVEVRRHQSLLQTLAYEHVARLQAASSSHGGGKLRPPAHLHTKVRYNVRALPVRVQPLGKSGPGTPPASPIVCVPHTPCCTPYTQRKAAKGPLATVPVTPTMPTHDPQPSLAGLSDLMVDLDATLSDSSLLSPSFMEAMRAVANLQSERSVMEAAPTLSRWLREDSLRGRPVYSDGDSTSTASWVLNSQPGGVLGDGPGYESRVFWSRASESAASTRIRGFSVNSDDSFRLSQLSASSAAAAIAEVLGDEAHVPALGRQAGSAWGSGRGVDDLSADVDQGAAADTPPGCRGAAARPPTPASLSGAEDESADLTGIPTALATPAAWGVLHAPPSFDGAGPLSPYAAAAAYGREGWSGSPAHVGKGQLTWSVTQRDELDAMLAMTVAAVRKGPLRGASRRSLRKQFSSRTRRRADWEASPARLATALAAAVDAEPWASEDGAPSSRRH